MPTDRTPAATTNVAEPPVNVPPDVGTMALPLLASRRTRDSPSVEPPPETLAVKEILCVSVAGLGVPEESVVVVGADETVKLRIGDVLAMKPAAPL